MVALTLDRSKDVAISIFQFLVSKCQNCRTTPSFGALAFLTHWDRYANARINRGDDPSASYRNFGYNTLEFAINYDACFSKYHWLS